MALRFSASTDRPIGTAATRLRPAAQHPPRRGPTAGSPSTWPQASPRCACGGTCPRCGAGSGRALPAALAQSLGRHLGADLSGVQVHTGAQAAHAVAWAGARRAFASGEHIVVGDPAFDAHSVTGRRLLAHEAAHVVQQRRGDRAAAADATGLEHEAQRAAESFGTGHPAPPVRAGQAPPGAVQRDEPAPGGGTTPEPDLDLQGELFVARWLARHGAAGGLGDPAGDLGAPLPPTWLGTPRLGAETLDFGSLLTPYFDRGVLPAGHGDTRDLDVVNGLFSDRYRLVLHLPDLRAAAPGFVRPLIPADWRVKLAATLTSTTVDWALSHDHPTYFELSNQTWERFTGARTISLPMVPVPLLNDWWNRFSGGGR